MSRLRGCNPGKGTSRRMDPAALIRFLKKIKIEGDCWIWQGCKDDKGYGRFKWAGRPWWVHRLSYATFKGRIRNRNEIDHSRCPMRAHGCVNPDHLRQTSKSANSKEGAKWRALLAKEVPF